MAKFIFTADRPLYYPGLGLSADPGMTKDFESAPDAHWQPAEVTPATAEALAEPIAKEAAENA